MLTSNQPRPQFSEQDAIRFAKTIYGIGGSARELPSERDQNFHLTSKSGQAFVLKISNLAETRAVLDCQNKALAHLAAQASTVTCPQVCRTVRDEEIYTVAASDGSSHYLRLLTYLSGVPLADFNPHNPELLQSLGTFLGQMDRALAAFDHPASRRSLHWDLRYAAAIVRTYLDYIPLPERRSIVSHFLSRFETDVVPKVKALRTSVIHNDANDYNVLVGKTGPARAGVTGIIDFGDMVHTYTVCNLAVALAYVMLRKADPVAAAADVVNAYHGIFPLTELELEMLFDFSCIRLCTSVALSAYQHSLEPYNPYLQISEQPAWELLQKLAKVHPRLACYSFRQACQFDPCPPTAAVISWLRDNRTQIGPVVAADVKCEGAVVFDLSVGSLELGNLAHRSDREALTRLIFDRMQADGANVGVGRYNEARQIYASEAFRSEGNETSEWRTVHLGLDLFLAAGSPVFAPLDGTIHSLGNNTAPLDYGPTIIIRHDIDDGQLEFFTLYGHLSKDSLAGLQPGLPVRQGDQIARIGSSAVNGGWPPHLHFQIITDLLGREGEFPGVALPGQRQVWLSICPDPNLIVGIPAARLPPDELSPDEVMAVRLQRVGKSLSISYRTPLKIVRGCGQYLFDDTGRAYLDCVNNVCHVGHCQPRVVEAAHRQAAVLNTNTRYLHDNLVRYAERLCAKFPEPLRVCFFVCTGSEANELALRLALAHTHHTDLVVLDGAYHGNTTSLVEVSPYKFDGPGGAGAPPHVRKVPMPDGYRGPFRHDDPAAGRKYARHVKEAIAQIHERKRTLGAFICESLLGCGGQIVLPNNYLREVYRHVRAAGGVCVADEVQVGFGRVGSHFWGFETQDVVPDIVTLGKPMGNGHPLAAVVTRPEIAESFDNGMEYFNTFGGNPVSCAVGLAVLDVIEDENLQQNALAVGAHLKDGLTRLMTKYPLIGEVRGLGLFMGVELVQDRASLAPAPDEAAYVVERMKEHGILLSTDGPHHNVIKIKPPLVFSEADADFLVGTLEQILAEDVLNAPI